jgi:hypothetical protein
VKLLPDFLARVAMRTVRLLRLVVPLLLTSALAQAQASSLLERWSKTTQLWRKEGSRVLKSKWHCRRGQTYNGRKCVGIKGGIDVRYCKYHARTFTPESYKYFGKNYVFSLPALLDAVQPAPGEYTVNGNCTFILDSNCKIQRTFSCAGCCYLSPTAQTFTNVPCLTDVSKLCNITYSANSATCGTPPPDIIDTTICLTCVLGSS